MRKAIASNEAVVDLPSRAHHGHRDRVANHKIGSTWVSLQSRLQQMNVQRVPTADRRREQASSRHQEYSLTDTIATTDDFVSLLI